MSFPRYPAYKPSGVAWLGEVPEHWSVGQSRRRFRLRNEPAREEDQQLTASQKHGVIKQADFVESEGRRVVEVVKGQDILKHVEPGDFVISMRSFQGGLEYSRIKGSISSAYVMLAPVKEVIPAYFSWLFKSQPYIQALQSTTNLVRDGQALRFSNFCQVDIPLIPADEQLAIATFLDRETAKIDALISEQQRLIELLQEKRQAVISHAVTKGLHPDAPMKDSGVKWLGEVPEHWEVMDLAKTTSLLQTGPFGSQLGTSDYKGEGIAVINPSNISEGEIDTSNGPFIATSKALELRRHRLHKGDLIIARRGEMGRCAVVKDEEEEKVCGTGSILIRPLDWMCAHFMAHVIRSEYSRASLSLNSVGSTMENLSAGIVGRLRIPVPPKGEQVQIVERIRRIASDHQSLANDAGTAINLLQERRSALVSAAVTGQIDVRGLTPDADAT